MMLIAIVELSMKTYSISNVKTIATEGQSL